MEKEHLEALKEAVEGQRKRESLEEAVGRVARKRGFDFSAYVAIMSEVRERARADKGTPEEAAKAILSDEGENAQ